METGERVVADYELVHLARALDLLRRGAAAKERPAGSNL